jgi:hypothetical protein
VFHDDLVKNINHFADPEVRQGRTCLSAPLSLHRLVSLRLVFLRWSWNEEQESRPPVVHDACQTRRGGFVEVLLCFKVGNQGEEARKSTPDVNRDILL